jgi:hypothetical protein
MPHRLSRLGRAVVMVVVLAALGGQQATAGWICLPPALSCVSWLFALGTLAQNIQSELQSHTALDESGDTSPPLCLTEAVSLSVWGEPAQQKVQVSQSVTVKIYGHFSQPVISFGFHLDYDSALLNLDQITLNPTFRALHSDYDAGVAGLAFPDGVSGDRVLLATARFTALGPGTTGIGLSATQADPTEGFAFVGCGEGDTSFTPSTVTIIQREPPPPKPPPPVPEPSSVLGLLAGAAWLRRRRAGR